MITSNYIADGEDATADKYKYADTKEELLATITTFDNSDTSKIYWGIVPVN